MTLRARLVAAAVVAIASMLAVPACILGPKQDDPSPNNPTTEPGADSGATSDGSDKVSDDGGGLDAPGPSDSSPPPPSETGASDTGPPSPFDCNASGDAAPDGGDAIGDADGGRCDGGGDAADVATGG